MVVITACWLHSQDVSADTPMFDGLSLRLYEYVVLYVYIYIYTHVYTYMHIHYINIIQLYIIILHMRIILSI